MSLVGRVGRKQWRARLAMAILYTLLAVGAVTTLYPFGIMVSTGFKCATDQNEAELIPKFWSDDALLLKKQGLYLLEETVLMHVVANMALDGEVETETCDGIDNIGLMDRLRLLAEDGKKFDTVLVIGHSNEDEL